MKRWSIVFALILAACSTQVQTITPVTPGQFFDAVLTDIEGNVTLNGQPALDKTQLQVGDIVQTADESEATIVFFDTSRTHVWDNTTLAVQRLQHDQGRSVQLRQTSGEIWTRLLRLSDVSDFEVITPSTVATVRGTGFWVAVRNGITSVGVTEGKVQLQRTEGNQERTLEKEQQVIDDQQMTVQPLVHDEFIDENLQKDEEFINAVREKIGNETFNDLMQEQHNG